MPNPRAKLASIIGFMGPAANASERIVTHELVPLREEIFHGSQLDEPQKIARALHIVQRHCIEGTASARGLPFLGGAYWPNVAFTANVANSIAHGLVGDVAWWPVATRPASANGAAVTNGRIVEVKQDSANNRITLSSNETCIVDLYFFSRPQVSK